VVLVRVALAVLDQADRVQVVLAQVALVLAQVALVPAQAVLVPVVLAVIFDLMSLAQAFRVISAHRVKGP
jgi:hypothetical protein